MSVLNFGNEPGLKYEILACGPLVRSRRNMGVFGHNKGVACSTRETVTNPAQPMVPAVPRAPSTSPAAILIAGSGLAPFLMSKRRPTGGYLHPRAKAVVFHAQGRSRGAWGRKGAAQAPPVGLLDSPIAGLVRGCRSILTPPMAPMPKKAVLSRFGGGASGQTRGCVRPRSCPGRGWGVCGRRLGPQGPRGSAGAGGTPRPGGWNRPAGLSAALPIK